MSAVSARRPCPPCPPGPSWRTACLCVPQAPCLRASLGRAFARLGTAGARGLWSTVTVKGWHLLQCLAPPSVPGQEGPALRRVGDRDQDSWLNGSLRPCSNPRQESHPIPFYLLCGHDGSSPERLKPKHPPPLWKKEKLLVTRECVLLSGQQSEKARAQRNLGVQTWTRGCPGPGGGWAVRGGKVTREPGGSQDAGSPERAGDEGPGVPGPVDKPGARPWSVCPHRGGRWPPVKACGSTP